MTLNAKLPVSIETQKSGILGPMGVMTGNTGYRRFIPGVLDLLAHRVAYRGMSLVAPGTKRQGGLLEEGLFLRSMKVMAERAFALLHLFRMAISCLVQALATSVWQVKHSSRSLAFIKLGKSETWGL